MESVPKTSIKKPRGRMARRMMFVLLPITLIPLMIIGTLTYAYGRDFLRQQAFSLLATVADTQGQRILEQVETGELLLTRLLGDVEFLDALDDSLGIKNRRNPKFGELRAALIDKLQTTNQPKPFFNQFLIVKPDGMIHLATRGNWQGRQIDNLDVKKLLENAPASQAGYIAQRLMEGSNQPTSEEVDGFDINSFVIMTAIPYVDQDGNTQAYIVGISESAAIHEFITQATFYSDQAYFVTPQGQFIAINPYPNSFNKLTFLPALETHKKVFSYDPDNATTQATELDESVKVHREPVIAASSYLDELGIAWAVEVLQESVYSQIDVLIQFAFLVLGLLLVVIGLVVWLLTRNLTRPVLELTDTVQEFSSGVWDRRSTIQRRDEIGLLSDSFNTMADEISALYGRLESQVQDRTGELNTLAELSQITITSKDLDELLSKTLELLTQRFNLAYAAVFLTDQSQYEELRYATLRQATGTPQVMQRARLKRVSISPSNKDALAGISIANNRAQVRPLIHPAENLSENESQKRYYEAAIPIAIGDRVLGALNLFAARRSGTTTEEPFPPSAIAELKTFSNQIASSVRNFQLIEASEVNLDEANMLFQTGHRITQAEDEDSAIRLAQVALQMCAYRSAILLVKKDVLHLVYHWDDELQSSAKLAQIPTTLPLENSAKHFTSATPVVVSDMRSSDLPQKLLDIPRLLGCYSAAFLPAVRGDRLVALLILGSAPTIHGLFDDTETRFQSARFTTVTLQPFTNLIELLAITMEKIKAQRDTNQRLVELETLWNISRTISIETDLLNLFKNIHHQIELAMGELNTVGFGIYDAPSNTISFPYMFEDGRALSIKPFQLGKGLTSLVLNSKEPLLLVEDTERKTRELGAMVVGKPAKSWLGVPLLFGGEAAGIIIVQDNEREHRFNQEDQRLLSTMAAQVAVAVRNVRLLETTRGQAEHERLTNEISGKIRRSVDIHRILKTTADELGSALKLRSARIEILDAPEGNHPVVDTSSGNGGTAKHQEDRGSNGAKSYG